MKHIEVHMNVVVHGQDGTNLCLNLSQEKTQIVNKYSFQTN